MLDVSRDRVPTLQTLHALVDRLAGWKINQLQLYMEHTFAYAGHEDVWRHADPYTARTCTPSTPTAGRAAWSSSPTRTPWATSSGGCGSSATGRSPSPPTASTGCSASTGPPSPSTRPSPRPSRSSRTCSASSCPDCRSRRVHVGMDEPWELQRRAARRVGPVAARLARASRCSPARELLVWGDVPAVHPELLGELPDGVTVCEWGYEDNHPFDERAARLADAGVPFWVCPGTSSWMSIAGRVDNMIENVRAAAVAGVAHGAAGLLVTDWGDMGHHQQPWVSDPGFATAAALGWCADAPRRSRRRRAGRAPRRPLLRRPDRHARAGPWWPWARPTAWSRPAPPTCRPWPCPCLLPQWPMGKGLTDGLTGGDLDARAGPGRRHDDRARRAPGLGRADGALVTDEIRATAASCAWRADDLALRLGGDGTLASVPPPVAPPWSGPGRRASRSTGACGWSASGPAGSPTARPGSTTCSTATARDGPTGRGSGPSGSGQSRPRGGLPKGPR